MPCRIVTTNQFSGLTPSGIAADTGYALANLCDDVVARPFRSSSAATTHTILVNRAVTTTFNWIGGFDFGGSTSGRTALVSVALTGGPDGVAWPTTLGTIVDFSDRGDWGKHVGNFTDQWIRFIVTLSASEKLDVGLLVCGVAVDLPKTFTTRQQNRDRGVVVNESDGGATTTGRLRGYREIVNLNWSVLDAYQHAAMLKIEDDVGGQFSPLVLQPDVRDPLTIFHGRIEPQTWSQDPSSFYQGHALAFRESGRAL